MNVFSDIKHLFKSPFDHRVAYKLYIAIVSQARTPIFYSYFEVRDTLEGRFDLLALHTYLVIRRLRDEQKTTSELSQALFDLMFADIDQNLREMSYGDTGVARRIKEMAEGFYGRVKVYDEGLEPGSSISLLQSALDRNLYRNTTPATSKIEKMAYYVRAQESNLKTQRMNNLINGEVKFCGPLNLLKQVDRS